MSSRITLSRSKFHADKQQNIDDGVEINGSRLVKLIFDVLGCFSRRLSKEQQALKDTELGELGPEFDSALLGLTDKLLLTDCWLTAQAFYEKLYQVIVKDAQICSRGYWKKWQDMKVSKKGRSCVEKWFHFYSGRKQGLLATRRMFIVCPTPSIMYGCLSGHLKYGTEASKDLVSESFLSRHFPNSVTSSVYLAPISFGSEVSYLVAPYACFGRISTGVFFGLRGIDGDNLQVDDMRYDDDWPDNFRVHEKKDPWVDYNPFAEMLGICELFESRIEDAVKKMHGLELFGEDSSSLEALLTDMSRPEIKALSYYDICYLIHRIAFRFHEVLNKAKEEQRFDYCDEIAPVYDDLLDALRSFKINVWYSDLHYFFAYFRGKTVLQPFVVVLCLQTDYFAFCEGFDENNNLLFNPWYMTYPPTLKTVQRPVENFLRQFDWSGMSDWLQVYPRTCIYMI